MIVFYLCIIIISLIITLLLSSLIIDIKNIGIEDINNLKKIYKAIESKRYDKIFNYLKFQMNIKIELFSIVPITILKVNNSQIKNMIQKMMIKDLQLKKENKNKYKLKRKKQKQFVQKMQKKINPYVDVKYADIYMNLSLTNAGVTALVTGIMNVMISFSIMCFAEELLENNKLPENKVRSYNNLKQINYEVKPIYTSDFVFNLKSKFKAKFPIFCIL